MTLLTTSVFCRNMSSKTRHLLVPTGVRGMKVLDREKFLRNFHIPILRVTQQNISKVILCCKAHFLKLENFKPVQSSNDEKFNKYLYLNPETISNWTDLSEDSQLILNDHGCTEANFTTKEVTIGYENWSYNTIFKAVLPEGEEIVSGFSQVGHIIHLNLREHLLDYSPLIGQVLLDKIKTCRTVVNKSNIIDNTYRNFNMEIIAGDEDYLVTVKENNCSFQFDFSKVYWNSRLGKEHERILSYLKPGDILFDIFCGVGPFSVPAVKRKCKVYANDLNPDSFKWLNHNAEKNKIDMLSFKSYNLDGKDFISEVFKNYLLKLCKGEEKLNDAKIHVTMNLPAMAVEFLKYFKGLLDFECIDKLNCEIIIYVYCFAVGDNPCEVAKQLVNENMGIDMNPYILDVFDVRNVSPKKEMIRVTIKLTEHILINTKIHSLYEPPLKKVCIESSDKKM